MSRPEFDAESAVIACALQDAAAYWRVADIVTVDDFRNPGLRAIWGVIGDQLRKGAPADAVTIGDVSPDLAVLAVDVANNTLASVRNVRNYAELMSRRALDRRVKQAGQRIANLTGEDTLGEAQKILGACVPRTGASIGMLSEFVRKSLAGVMEREQSEQTLAGVATGFEPLDELTGGWQRTDLVIVAARPSVGKTAFALQSAIAAATANVPAMFVSLEMNGTQLADRAVAHITGVNALHIRNPRDMTEDEWPMLTTATRRTEDLPLHIDESSTSTVDAIAARIRQVDAEHRLGLVVIDYLTYIAPPKAETTAEGIQIITRSLKALAKELNLPVILLSQLNRDGDDEPSLKHLRGSGAIEQDADVVVFLHRPDKQNRELVKVSIAKQRNGPLGDFHLAADMARMRFTPTDNFTQPIPFRRPQRGFGGGSRSPRYED